MVGLATRVGGTGNRGGGIGWGGRHGGACYKGGGGVFLLSVQHCGEYISTMFGCI